MDLLHIAISYSHNDHDIAILNIILTKNLFNKVMIALFIFNNWSKVQSISTFVILAYLFNLTFISATTKPYLEANLYSNSNEKIL
jgi:hypothetical protein